MNTLLISIGIILLIVCIVLAYYLFRARREFKQWMERQEKRLVEVRKQAIEQSRAVLGGKFVEHMAPYLPEFKYDPTEARFIGNPIDLVVFPGLAIREPTEVVLIEVKTGKSSGLTAVERKIRDLIKNGKVRWELIRRPSVEAEVEVRGSSELGGE